MTPLPKGIRFAAALAILGLVFFLLPPQAAGLLGVLLVLGALMTSGKDPVKVAAPINEFFNLIYGAK